MTRENMLGRIKPCKICQAMNFNFICSNDVLNSKKSRLKYVAETVIIGIPKGPKWSSHGTIIIVD